MDIIITEKAQNYLRKKKCSTIILDMTLIGGNACWSGHGTKTQYLPSVRMGLNDEDLPLGFSELHKDDIDILVSFRFKAMDNRKVIIDSKKVLFSENLKVTFEDL